MRYAEQMQASKNPIDKCFINLYVFRKAGQRNIRFGFQNDMFLTDNRRIGGRPNKPGKKIISSKAPSNLSKPSLTNIEEVKSM